MSNKRKFARAAKKRATDEFDGVIRDTAAVLSCLHETSQDFAYQCKTNGEDLEGDLRFTQLAYEIWQHEKSSHAQELAVALADLRAARQQHLAALAVLGERFIKLEKENTHEHLDVPSYDYVRSSLFPESASD